MNKSKSTLFPQAKRGVRLLSRALTTAILTGSLSQAVHAQTQPPFNYDKTQYVIPPMPEASSLGKYGEQNISLYTGKVNVSIPIYQISSHDIHLPISISYATGGVKVQDMASQVGLEWTLNASGVITRSVKGGPDDGGGGFVLAAGANMPAAGGAISEVGPNANDGIEKLHSFMTAGYDGESDIYNYNFSGITGSFFFDKSGGIHSTDVNNLKFSYTLGNKDGMYGFISFQVVTESGDTYFLIQSKASIRVPQVPLVAT